MGSGTSPMGKGGGGVASQATNAAQNTQTKQDAFINEMVTALNSNDPDNPMSNSDLQGAVEAYAMTHKGVDEDALLNTIRNKASAQAGGAQTTSTQITAPSDFRASIINGRTVSDYAKQNGLDAVSDSALKNLPIGTKVVVSSPVMNSRVSSRRDPDAVHFMRGTFIGFQPAGAHRPLVQLDGGKKVAVETDYPFETIYRKG